jgi:hypothetical protein
MKTARSDAPTSESGLKGAYSGEYGMYSIFYYSSAGSNNLPVGRESPPSRTSWRDSNMSVTPNLNPDANGDPRCMGCGANLQGCKVFYVPHKSKPAVAQLCAACVAKEIDQ